MILDNWLINSKMQKYLLVESHKDFKSMMEKLGKKLGIKFVLLEHQK